MRHKFWTKSCKTPSHPKYSTARVLSSKFRVVAWLNILIQLLFPLSLSFSPAIAAISSNASTTVTATEPYTLGVGESVQTIAKKYGISVDELKKINNYRTFAKPFTALTTGDEIDVPRKASPFSVDKEINQTAGLPLENRLAGHVQAGATALATGNAAKSGERMVRSAANNEFNSSAQDWLSQFGTAKVQLNVNDNFQLDGSAVDVLVPLYDNQKSLLFSQLGARNKDSRNTVNIGAGVRTYQDNWMLGANTFFDNDITGKNRRVGVGAEAWTDYLKLSANSYFGTTRWHQSRDFADYNERPANGYDLRADAYLPAHPQLGGKLMYEKYRGDEVALFGKDNRQKDPHAVTAGVNYTPFPLLTVGTEHRAGKGGQSDSSINFQFNYRLGESWQSHISPSAVAGTRTLAGSRYDLVERNNNIVLDYQKQELLRLTLPEQITGEAGSTATINAQVTSKYGLERIDWDSTHLVSGGGQLSQTSANTVSITLPAYQTTTATGGNRYALSAVAYDTQGNRSNPSALVIIVEPQRISVVNSQSKITPEVLLADGRMTGQIVVTLRDGKDQPVVGAAKSLALSSNFVAEGVSPQARSTASLDVQLSDITESAAGVYSATLTAGTQPGAVTIIPSINNLNLDSVKATFTANNIAAVVDSLSADKPSAFADGNGPVTLTATLKDDIGHLLADTEVVFSSTGGKLSSGTVRTDNHGQASVLLTSAEVGTVTVTAKAATNAADQGKSQSVDFTVNMATGLVHSLTADRTTAFADANTPITLTATLKDGAGHLLSDAEVAFAATGGVLSKDKVQTDSRGQAKVALTSAEVGPVTVTVKSVANMTDTGKSHRVDFTVNTATAVVDSLTADNPTAFADGNSQIALTTVVKDAAGHGVPNADVSLTSTGGTLSSNTAKTNAEGQVTVTLTSTEVGPVTVTAKSAANATDTGKTRTVAFTVNSATAVVESLTMDAATAFADGNSRITFMTVVKDASDHKVADTDVVLTSTGGTLSYGRVRTNSEGEATVTLTSAEVGAITVTAKAAINTADTGKSQTVAFTVNAATGTVDSLMADHPAAFADGNTPITLIAIFKDGSGHLLPDADVAFATTGGLLSSASARTNAEGKAIVTLSSTVVDSVTVTARSANNAADAGKSQTLAFTVNPATAAVDSLTADKATAFANGGSAITFTSTLKDGAGHLLPNTEVTFATTGGVLSSTTARTNNQGQATVSLTSNEVLSATVTAKAATNAVDSGRSQRVSFTVDETSAVVASLSSDTTIAFADGSSQIAFIATVNDASGHAVPDTGVTLTSTGGTLSNTTVQTDSNGQATVTINSTVVGFVTVTAKSNANTADVGKYQTVAFTVNGATAQVDSLVSDTETAFADGRSVVTFTATVKDAAGHGVPDSDVALSTTHGVLSNSTVRTNGEGIATVTLTSSEVGLVTVTAKSASNVADAGKTKTVSFTVNEGAAVVDSLTADTPVAYADGNSLITLTATLKDNAGHLLPNTEVVLSTTGGTLSNTRAVTNNAGLAIVTLKHTRVETVTVTAKAATNAVDTGKSQSVAFTVNADSAVVDSLTTDAATAFADGNSPITFSAIIKDASGHVVPEANVTFRSTGGTLNTTTVQTDGNGLAVVTLTSAEVGSVTVTAKSGSNGADTGKEQTVAFTTNLATAVVEHLTADTTVAFADGNTAITLTVTMKDGAGHLLPDAEVMLETTGGILSSSTAQTDNAGQASFTLTSTDVGTVTVTARSASNTADAGKTQTVSFTVNEGTAVVDSLTADTPVAYADGNSLITLTATLKDNAGHLLPDTEVVLSTTGGTLSNTLAVTNSAGQAIVTLKHTRVETVTVTAKAATNAVDTGKSQSVAFTVNADSAVVDSLTTDAASAFADGNSPITFSAIIRDASGHVVPEANVTFSTTGGTLNTTTVQTDGNGLAVVTLTSAEVGSVTVTAKSASNGADTGKVQTVMFIANAATGTVVSLTADTLTAFADGSDTITVTAILKDGTGHVLPDTDVSMSTSGGTLSSTTARTNSEGEVTVTLKNTVVEMVNVTAKSAANAADPGKILSINFTVNATTAMVDSLTTDTVMAFADGSSPITLTTIVKDASGHRVPDADVTFTSNGGLLSRDTARTDSEGEATVSLTSAEVGSVIVTAKSASNTADTGKDQTVTFTVNAATAVVETLTAENTTAYADSHDPITLTATLKDGAGHAVPDTEIILSSSGGTLSSTTAITNGAGQVRFTLTSTAVGDVTVTAKSSTNTADEGQSQTVTFTANASTAVVDSLSVDTDSAFADGSTPITFSAIIKDASGHVVPDAEVTIATTGGTLSNTRAQTNNAGLATVTLTHSEVDTVSVTAKAATNAADAGKTRAVNFTVNAATAVVDSLTVDTWAVEIFADGISKRTFTATVKDVNGHVVPDTGVTLSTSIGTLSATTVQTDRNGQVEVALTSTVVGSGTVKAQSTINTADVGKSLSTTFIANASTGVVESLTANADSAFADGNSPITFTATIRDNFGHVVRNTDVNFTTTNGILSSATARTDLNGQASVTLQHTEVGAVTVKAQSARNTADTGQDLTVSFIPNAATGVVDSLTANTSAAFADGSDPITLTATLKDATGHVVPDAEITLSSNGGTLSSTSATTNNVGQVSFTLTSLEIGDITVTAKSAINTADVGKTQTVTFSTNAMTGAVDNLTVDSTTAFADGNAIVTLTATLKDGAGHLLSDTDVTLASTGGMLSSTTVRTDNNGQAAVTLTSAEVGPVTVTAKSAMNAADPGKSQTVSFIADESSATIDDAEFIVSSGAVANGSDTNEIGATVRDAYGHLLKGINVTFKIDSGSAQINGSTVQTIQTDNNGVARASVVSTVAGENIITASVGNTVSIGKSSSFIIDVTTSTIKSLSGSSSYAFINSEDGIVLTATLQDNTGAVLPNAEVSFTTTGGTLSEHQVMTNEKGIAKTILTNSNEEEVIVTAKSSANSNDPGKNIVAAFIHIDSLEVAVDNDAVNVGDVINMTITGKDKNGALLSGYRLSIKATASTGINGAEISDNRQVVADKSKDFIIGGGGHSFPVDATGVLKIALTNPNGIGAKTTLLITADEHSVFQDVIFKNPEQPDVSSRYYGSMVNSVDLDGYKFMRPIVANEFTVETTGSKGSHGIARTTWLTADHVAASDYCSSLGASLPTEAQLKSLLSSNAFVSSKWPSSTSYRADAGIVVDSLTMNATVSNSLALVACISGG